VPVDERVLDSRPDAPWLPPTRLLGYVRKHNYTPFVIYRLIVALIILLLIATGVREATF